MSLMKVTDCTHLAYFWPISYDHTRAVQLQNPEVYPPLLPLLSTHTDLQMCCHVYLQMFIQVFYKCFLTKRGYVAPAPQFISVEQLRSHSTVTQASLW